MSNSQSPFSRWYTVAMLFVVGCLNFMDRQILSILLEPIKLELKASDSAMGVLTGFAFVSFYTLSSLPIARAADSYSRRNIIALGLAFWSVMTSMSGSVSSFAQLAAARVGVGVGEASSLPAGHSIVSDLFPPRQRSVALSIIAVSTPIGLMIAFIVGGWLNATVGWRKTLLIVGLPGLLLALIVWLTVKEPVRGAADQDNGDHNSYDLKQTLSYLWSCRSLRYLTIGGSLTSFAGWSILVWSASFLLRVHSMPTNVSGPSLGLATGVGGVMGTLLAGFAVQKLGQRNERWFMLVPAITCFVGAPFIVLFLLVAKTAAVPMYFVVVMFGPSAIGPVSTVIQAVAKVRMRAFAAAFLLMIVALVGVGGGPFCVGVVSDLLAPHFGSHSLRYALMLAAVSLSLAGIVFAVGDSHLKLDLARAKCNNVNWAQQITPAVFVLLRGSVVSPPKTNHEITRQGIS